MAGTKIGQLSQELSRTNLWWRSDGWLPTDPDLRAAEVHQLVHRSKALDELAEQSPSRRSSQTWYHKASLTLSTTDQDEEMKKQVLTFA